MLVCAVFVIIIIVHLTCKTLATHLALSWDASSTPPPPKNQALSLSAAQTTPPMKTSSYLPRLLCLALALAWTQGALASTIINTVFWGSLYNDNLYNSSGQTLDSSYSFEIGTFNAGFTPTYQNVNQWDANWHVIALAYTPDSNGWNASAQFFDGTAYFDTNNISATTGADPTYAFTTGDTAYLWAYNSKTIVPSSEWALVTYGASAANTGDPWVIPNIATSGSYNWNLGDASTAIIGGANGVQGPGDYSANPGVFSLQTAVVPEPGSAFLLLAAAAAHLTRRMRRLSRMSLL